ncbi:uncharacterized protein LOC121732911 [Aricia agestis]|uniref:uncharacterized protein LOC121732911 n=1 Tax=Aricia agestis TaxID=91739 RepID=UPI001C20773C|nr:uncharacterized protein LOC121732911 [Aricia agestis]
MSFELSEPKTAEGTFFEREAPPERAEEYPADVAAHADLFDTISEAHYLPELAGPHDEALLESLVEKGCEDNQILGQTLDKLAHLVHGAGEYAEEEEDMLLAGAPVADLIDRLEQTLESPARSSITAAQGLLHLHNIGDHLPPPERRADDDRTFGTDRLYAEENGSADAKPSPETQEESGSAHTDYDHGIEQNLENNVPASETNYNIESVPETNGAYSEDKTYDDAQIHSVPDQSEITSDETEHDNLGTDIADEINEKLEDSQEGKVDENYEEKKDDAPALANDSDYGKDGREALSNNEDVGPTDLSIKHVERLVDSNTLAGDAEASNIEDNMSVKSDEQPKDLTVHRRLPTPHASPRRTDVPRAPSRESDAMQSPQPSGIPAVPSSPEIFNVPLGRSKQTVFLESLLSSPSPKMYTSEVTITKQQCEPLNLGKHRKSASPTVSSCSDEIKKMTKEFGEPQEKKSRPDAGDELAKMSKVFAKCDEQATRRAHDRRDAGKSYDECSPLKQFQILKSSPDFNIPDPLLIPKDKLNKILENPVREIPGLLIQRPELRLPQAFAFPAVLQDPDILVISLSQLESILMNEEKPDAAPRGRETKPPPRSAGADKAGTPQPEPAGRPKPIPSMDALAGDIDAATSAALNQMLWLPYISQLEAMAACSQNMDFIKALNSSGYPGYPDLAQMFPGARFPGPAGFPVATPMDYDGRLQLAMWQEAAAAGSRAKPDPKDGKAGDVQNPYVHSTRGHGGKGAARGPPGYGARPPFPAYPPPRPAPPPALQIPYFAAGRARAGAGGQRSPPSPYYPGREARAQESPRPRISVKSLQNLLEPGARRRRRDEPEVGSTTPGEPPPPDPAAYHLWHPLFGNQKSYNSPWSWTTVTATGD